MKKTLKNWGTRLALVLFFACGMSMIADAQVPSIPRRQSTYRAKPKRTQTRTSRNTVWGTQYDWLSTRYCTYSDIRNLDRGQVRVLKNSIYARHGRRFRDANLRRYFQSQRWYNPWRSEVPSSEFNRYESYNISFLLRYE
ncbi:MAG: YARHG domain-containing protein [Prevotella sp.]|nr:YARHG domain-containing protein [Prevotella sp.]